MVYRSILILILAFHANTVFARDLAPSIRPVLELIAITNAQLKHCKFEDSTGDKQAAIDAAFIALSEALYMRAIALGRKEEDARKGVADYITLISQDPQITRGPKNLKIFRQKCPKNLKRPMEILKSQEFQKYLSDYTSLPWIYDSPFILSGTTLETYAGPMTQRRLLDTLSYRMGCRDIRPISISLDEKSVIDSTGLPIFVQPTIRFIEIWEVECRGRGATKSFKVSHSRDSEGPAGFYSVE
ncbi:hypothetical protein GN278_17105 [Rhodobacteraceae bacterium Araon29]